MQFKTNGIRVSDYQFDDESIKILQDNWKSHVEDTNDYPGGFSGKGIVLTAGGLRYTTCAWVAINMIRHLGCTLPIELWYQGNELSEEVIKEFEGLDVVCRNFSDFEFRHFTGYMLKPLAILKSTFKEVLFIDADNNCVQDPARLFALKEFKKYGAVFWPDFWRTSRDNSIWSITGSKKFDIPEQESGQILIDKEKCWKELNLCLHFNAFSQYYYRILLGDKDTFKFAWLALETPFHMIEIPVGSCGYIKDKNFYGTTMVQHDPSGEIYFLHRNLLKWDVTRDDEITWEKIIRFLPDASERTYHLTHPDNEHYYMELKGDVEVLDFKDLFSTYEYTCHNFLKSWRRSHVFKQFVEYSHFATYRYRNGHVFSLA